MVNKSSVLKALEDRRKIGAVPNADLDLIWEDGILEAMDIVVALPEVDCKDTCCFPGCEVFLD